MSVRLSKKPLALAAFLALAPLPAGAGAPYLVKDINPAATPVSSFPRMLGTVAGKAVVEVDDGTSGAEPWITDGTVAGTFRLADLCPGSCSSFTRLIAADGRRLYFGSPLGEIWVTDGTRAGTFSLNRSPLFPAGGSSVQSLGRFSGNLFYFLASETVRGPEVWRTDGTVAGTFRISDIQPTSGQTEITEFTAFDGKLVFVANDGRGPALWVADGTRAGTRRIFDPDPGSSTNPPPTNLVRAGRYVYFVAFFGSLGRELWRTDGTAAGTVNVADLVRGPSGLTRFASRAFGDRLLFAAEGSGLTQQLRITSGTAASMRVLTRFGPGIHFFNLLFEGEGATLTAVDFGGRAYLGVNDGAHGFELWHTDGTQAGTRLFKDVCPGECGGWQGFGGEGLARGFFFRGDDGVRGREVWFTDGTAAGTHLARDLCRGACNGSDFIGPATRIGPAVLFVQYSLAGDSLLWRSDGSTRGTVALASLDSRSTSSSSFRIAAAGTGAVFPGFVPALGLELWRSDGTPAGTGLLADLNPHQAGAGSDPAAFLPVGGGAVFVASDPELGRVFFRTDGTGGGTAPLLPARGGVSPTLVSSTSRRRWAQAGPLTFFPANGLQPGVGLWRTDGTSAGTFPVTPDGVWLFPVPPAPVAGKVFFTVESPRESEGLWVSDGSVAGTHRVAGIELTAFPYRIGEIASFQGLAYFAASPEASGAELWSSDGTDAGTRMVKDLEPEPGRGSSPGSFVEHGGKLYFAAETGADGKAIWRTDGTAAGTVRVLRAGVLPGVEAVAPYASVGGRLFVVATLSDGSLELATIDGATEALQPLASFAAFADRLLNERQTAGSRLYLSVGANRALWVSDGTAAGTRAVVDGAGNAVDHCRQLLALGGRVLFEREDQGLWVSDGTPGGLRSLGFSGDGTGPDYAVLGSRVIGAAYDPEIGSEVWGVEP